MGDHKGKQPDAGTARAEAMAAQVAAWERTKQAALGELASMTRTRTQRWKELLLKVGTVGYLVGWFVLAMGTNEHPLIWVAALVGGFLLAGLVKWVER